METTRTALDALRDLRGVEGSFYASRDGDIVLRDMPRIYDGDDLGDVATRMSRFFDALVDLGGANEGVMVRHPHHTVFLRATEDGFLAVLATSDVNVPALKRGVSLVTRRLPKAASIGRSSAPPLDPAALFAPDPVVTYDSTPAMRLSAPPPLPPEARRAVAPPPLPVAVAEEARPPRDSQPGMVHRSRVSVPGAPTPRASQPSAPAIRWRGTVKDS